MVTSRKAESGSSDLAPQKPQLISEGAFLSLSHIPTPLWSSIPKRALLGMQPPPLANTLPTSPDLLHPGLLAFPRHSHYSQLWLLLRMPKGHLGGRDERAGETLLVTLNSVVLKTTKPPHQPSVGKEQPSWAKEQGLGQNREQRTDRAVARQEAIVREAGTQKSGRCYMRD